MATMIYVVHTQAEAAAARQLDLHLHPYINRWRIRLDGSYKHGAGEQRLELDCQGINNADVIVLLVSARLFIECEESMQQAIARSKLGLAPVVPVLLNHVSLRDGILDGMVTLPRSPTRRSLAAFPHKDEAWVNVVDGIREVVEDLPARRARLRQETEQTPDPNKVQLLFLAANPSEVARQQLTLEYGKVRSQFESLGLLRRFEIKDRWNFDAADLATELLRRLPQVIHISAHALPNGRILLQGVQKKPSPLTISELRQLLLDLPLRPKLLVLNSCYNGCEARTITDAVDAVIGFMESVSDAAAIRFAEILYMNLAQERSVQESFEQARSVVQGKTRVILEAKSGVEPAQLRLLVPKTA